VLAEFAARLTNQAFPGEAHREMRGLKKRWIRFLRNYPGYYRALYDSYRQPAQEKLVQVHLEPTSSCNLKCVTCHNPLATTVKGKMPLELARRIIDEAWSEMGVEGKLGFFIRGESVLHPQLAEMISYARKVGFQKLLLSTNVMLCTIERARKLLQSGLSELRLSIDAVDSETFETTRAGARFDLIVKNLEDLDRANTELGRPCHFRMHASLHRRSFERVPEFVRRWEHMVQQFRFTVAVNQGGLFPREEAAGFSGMSFATSTAFQIPCRILYDYIGVTWDGKLTSCCVDYREKFVVGEIGGGIRAGFTGAAARKIKDDHLHGRFGDLCGNCGFNNVLVDWFEDELNDYVSDHMSDMRRPECDGKYRQVLNRMIEKFDAIAARGVAKRDFFG
jgi:hypothetical protein